MHRLLAAVLTLSVAGLVPNAIAQSTSSSLLAPSLLSGDSPNGGAGIYAPASSTRPIAFSTVAVGVKVGVLGIGFETATPLSNHLNLRAGGNFFSYSDTLTSDGLTYNANLHFRSSEASVDYFPWAKSFHISPGALLYNGNEITGKANVAGGQTFTLNGTTYTSSASDPVNGNGSVTFNKAAPKITVGWGNLIPRSGRHFSVPVDLGFAYVGDPKVALNLNGTACYTYQGAPYCANVATDPTIHANVVAQQQKIANDAAVARFFPIVSAGFAYRF
ncbi:MAG TPA: hypothetical protein VFE06_08875 [Acidobacteriaceae bacterium]|jgi:hypothetical protein|nr:hypothetical protein [Acidobacteriaceae bacterium]